VTKLNPSMQLAWVSYYHREKGPVLLHAHE